MPGKRRSFPSTCNVFQQTIDFTHFNEIYSPGLQTLYFIKYILQQNIFKEPSAL